MANRTRVSSTKTLPPSREHETLTVPLNQPTFCSSAQHPVAYTQGRRLLQSSLRFSHRTVYELWYQGGGIRDPGECVHTSCSRLTDDPATHVMMH